MIPRIQDPGWYEEISVPVDVLLANGKCRAVSPKNGIQFEGLSGVNSLHPLARVIMKLFSNYYTLEGNPNEMLSKTSPAMGYQASLLAIVPILLIVSHISTL